MSLNATILFSATLDAEADPVRAASWMETFGSLTVPIVSNRAYVIRAPDGLVGLFFYVDVNRLNDLQRERIVRHVTAHMGIPAEEVRADLKGSHGIPVLSDNVQVIVDRFEVGGVAGELEKP